MRYHVYGPQMRPVRRASKGSLRVISTRISALTSALFLFVALFAFPSFTQSVDASPTGSSVHVSDNGAGSRAGGTETFTALVGADNPVAGVPTGDVSWNVRDSAGSSVTCNSTTVLSDGQASCSITNTVSGSYTATASYGGDGNSSPSSGSEQGHQIGHSSTSTVVSDDASGRVAGSTFTFTATVSGPGVSPTGLVSWDVTGPNGQTVGCATSTLNSSGQATCTVTHSLAGTYWASARYQGDSNCASSSGTTKAVIGQALLVIQASSPTMIYGSTVPAITPSYSGFVNGDTPASLTTPPVCTTAAASSSPVGTLRDQLLGCRGLELSDHLPAGRSHDHAGTPDDHRVQPASCRQCAGSNHYAQLLGLRERRHSRLAYDPAGLHDYLHPRSTGDRCSVGHVVPWRCRHELHHHLHKWCDHDRGLQRFGDHRLEHLSVTYGSPVPTITYTESSPVPLTTTPTCTTSYGQGAPVSGSYTTSCTGAAAPGVHDRLRTWRRLRNAGAANDHRHERIAALWLTGADDRAELLGLCERRHLRVAHDPAGVHDDLHGRIACPFELPDEL